MNEDLRKWLDKHGAVCLWSQTIGDGNICMFHIGGKTFLIRTYEQGGKNQGWEVFTNLDPADGLSPEKTLASLERYCFPDRGPMVKVPTKPIKV